MAKRNLEVQEQYPVKRGSRYDSLCLNLTHNIIVEGLSKFESDDERRMDYSIAMNAGNEGIQQFCRLVIYAQRGTNGHSAYLLSTVDGSQFKLPTMNDSPEVLAEAYIQYLKMDEDTIEEIDSRILESNKPLAPRYILPREQLTAEEKADPN